MTNWQSGQKDTGNRLKTLAAIAAAAVCLAGAGLLPFAVSTLQDHALLSVRRTYPGDLLTLAGNYSQLADRLRAAAGWGEEQNTALLDHGRNLDEEQALEAAVEAAALWEPWGLSAEELSDTVQSREAEPVAVISQEDAAMYIVWSCFLYRGDVGYIAVLIDDETGKMLAASFNDPEALALPDEALVERLAAYYGMDLTYGGLVYADVMPTLTIALSDDVGGGELYMYCAASAPGTASEDAELRTNGIAYNTCSTPEEAAGMFGVDPVDLIDASAE